MAKDPVNNLNVLSQDLLPTPQQVKSALPLTDKAQATVLQGRETVRRILDREDPRLFVVIGPCSIHDIKAAHEYAKRLKRLAEEVGDTLYLIMRVYFEKPRTTTDASNPPTSASPPRWMIWKNRCCIRLSRVSCEAA